MYRIALYRQIVSKYFYLNYDARFMDTKVNLGGYP